MTFPPFREFRLAGSRGDGRHAYVNAHGAFIGNGVPLLEKDGRGRWQPRPRPVLELLLGIGYGAPVDVGGRMDKFAAVARALDAGDLGRASVALVRAELDPLPDGDCAEAMAKADGLAKTDTSRELRDALARWATALDAATIQANAEKNGGWLAPQDVKAGNEKECVSLVRSVIPGLDHSSSWQEGEKIAPTGEASNFLQNLKPGTAIATFRNGRYNSTKADHAAIYLGPADDGPGIKVLDQFNKKDGAAQVRSYYYSGKGTFHVGDFSTIAKPPGR